ncbi:MAG TPA: YHS domain-containing protein [Gammaproteobacteria bacterium]|nr:YHS domain-containing protein [Gammaproteobacteria bacterium]
MNQDTRELRNRSQVEASRRDPVCGMVVDANENAVEYQQMHFAFCSLQCKERFLKNPHLYIGQGGHKAPKQEGQAVFKQRRLKLDRPIPPDSVDSVLNAVQAMMGIERIEIDGDIIKITYDLLQATEEQIESEIAQSGVALGDEWSERLRRAFVHYLEETEIESLAASTSSHRH